MRPTANGGFQCPLSGQCFQTPGLPFPSCQEANEAVARYRSAASVTARRRLANRLFLRHMLLVRKTLARFCWKSECFPGGCLVEELVGESYAIFRQALDDYEPSVGIDFLGYASRRLYWGLEHCARRHERALLRAPPSEMADPPAPRYAEEDRHLDRLLARKLLACLDAGDATLMADHAAGYSCQELARAAGLSHAAVRKRLERLRARLRHRVPARPSQAV